MNPIATRGWRHAAWAALALALGGPPAGAAAQAPEAPALDTATRRLITDSIARTVERLYPSADTGRMIAEHLRTREREGVHARAAREAAERHRARPASSSAAATDSAAIRAAALDYIEGWYTGDAARVERAVHPELAKRIVARRSAEGEGVQSMGAADLVEMARRGGGRDTPPERRRTEVRVLDVFGGAASVRVDAHGWVDYLHLARVDGEWRIVNVLWELRSPGT